VLFSQWLLHGSFDGNNANGRARLSTDLRWHATNGGEKSSRKRLTQTSHANVSRKRLMPIDYQQPMINNSIVCLLSRACLGKSSQKVNILSPSLRRSTLCMMLQQEVLTIVTKERTQAVRKPPLLLLRRFRMESNQSVAKTGSGQTQETLADKSARFASAGTGGGGYGELNGARPLNEGWHKR
jgi:hypothetical protein